ncbi:MAG: VanZ family protein [Acidobacteriota bacterium]
MSRTLKAIVFWLPPIFYLALIYYLSSISYARFGVKAPDYLLHFPEYFLLIILLVRAVNFGLKKKVGILPVLLCSIFSIAYAASDEIHQYYVPGRDACFSDFLTDVAGIVVGALFIILYQRYSILRSHRSLVKKVPDPSLLKSDPEKGHE